MNDRRIQEIEETLVGKKDWKYSGEIKASAREKNSLLDTDVEFETSVFNIPISKDENGNILKYITQRFKEKTFDNYEFKEIKPMVVEEVYDLDGCETNKEILELYDKIENALKKITDYGNDGYV